MSFPTDPATLALLRAACLVAPGAERSSLFDFLELMGTEGRVVEVIDDQTVLVAHDVAPPSVHEVIVALIDSHEALRDECDWLLARLEALGGIP